MAGRLDKSAAVFFVVTIWSSFKKRWIWVFASPL